MCARVCGMPDTVSLTFLICNSVFALKHQDAKYIFMFTVTLEMMQKQQNLTSD